MSAYLLGLICAVLGGAIAVMIPASVTGRLDIFYKPRTFFIWGVREEAGRAGWPWVIVAALARALGAFGVARIVFAVLAVPPAPVFAAALFLVLVLSDVRSVRLARRAPISIPPEIHSLNVLRATANSLAALALGVVFVFV